MKRVALIAAGLAALLAAAMIAPVLLSDPGLVTIEVAQWRVRMSALTLVGAVILIWIVVSVLVGLIRLPGRMARRERERRARQQMEKGLLALTEGDWAKAEQALDRSLQYRPSTLGYLAAARAAQGQAEEGRRDRWLTLADGRFGQRHFQTSMARARLLAGEGKLGEAIVDLERLHLRKPRHRGVLRLLLQAYQELDRWADVRRLAPALQRADIVDDRRRDELIVLAAAREIEHCSDARELQAAWRSLPRTLRRRRELIVGMARRATELGQAETAGRALKALLAESLDAAGLRLYAKVDDDEERGRRIDACRHWLQTRPEHAGLMRTLGLLELEQRRYDQAQDLLEKSLMQEPDGDAYAALGRIHERSGRSEAAAQCYRNALRHQTGQTVQSLPPPERSQNSRGD